MDIVYIRDLRINALIGVYEWERRIRQTLALDLDIGIDGRCAAASDAVGDTVDYGAVATRLVAFGEASRFELIETLAEQVAAIVLGEFKAPWVRIRISKRGAVPGAADVGVIIERGCDARA
jgi:dihydroneopterin aldolase